MIFLRSTALASRLVGVALVAAPAAFAQADPVHLTPGHPALVTAAPQSTVLDVRLLMPQVQALGTAAVTETLDGDRLTVTTDLQIPISGVDQQSETVLAYPSLAPISHTKTSDEGSAALAFADGRMTGATADAPAVDVEIAGAFGPSVTRLLIRSLPFADGFRATFDQLENDGARSTSSVHVTGRETLTRPDGAEREVWVVVETEAGSPDHTYYVDAETRELLRSTFAPQPGAEVELVAR